MMPLEQSAETYTISDLAAQRIYTEVRRAAQWVPFCLPHLRPGMALLDCGCGVGSITLDLAAIVESGRVVGLDLDEGQLEDDDDGAIVYSPNDPIMHKVGDLFMTMTRHNGANLTYARHLRGLILQAGFARSEGFAVAADYSGNLAATRRRADVLTRVLRDPSVAGLVAQQGWATQAGLDEMVAYLHEWGERPDVFFAIMYCAALGWKE